MTLANDGYNFISNKSPLTLQQTSRQRVKCRKDFQRRERSSIDSNMHPLIFISQFNLISFYTFHWANENGTINGMNRESLTSMTAKKKKNLCAEITWRRKNIFFRSHGKTFHHSCPSIALWVGADRLEIENSIWNAFEGKVCQWCLQMNCPNFEEVKRFHSSTLSPYHIPFNRPRFSFIEISVHCCKPSIAKQFVKDSPLVHIHLLPFTLPFSPRANKQQDKS